MPLEWLTATQDKSQATSLGRHRRNCTVCSHAKRAEIEADFVSWHGDRWQESGIPED
jgi:hypothetical protein